MNMIIRADYRNQKNRAGRRRQTLPRNRLDAHRTEAEIKARWLQTVEKSRTPGAAWRHLLALASQRLDYATLDRLHVLNQGDDFAETLRGALQNWSRGLGL